MQVTDTMKEEVTRGGWHPNHLQRQITLIVIYDTIFFLFKRKTIKRPENINSVSTTAQKLNMHISQIFSEQDICYPCNVTVMLQES